MLGWYRGQINEHGPVKATRLLVTVATSRTKVNLSNKLLPAAVSCPCCGWTGRRFHDYIEIGYRVVNAVCPQCESHSRHRYLFLWASEKLNLENKTGQALVFAPERALETMWTRARQLKVHRLDIEPNRGVDLLAEIERLPVASNSVDLIWCHHVLEHVEDDRAAMRELCRALRPLAGELIVSVPMAPGTQTDEYGFADPAISGHWRMYGDDFADRLTESGLSVELVEFDLPAERRRHFGIVPENFYYCRKMPTS